ncbi:hypothetical protein BDD12DRAFT_805954 [Trichophaea hybrida]|nr:hypothetical protein BDD12DRAFT_805954 [Trichophaea hybrida]
MMSPKGNSKGKGKARTKIRTLVINGLLLLDRNRITGFISEHVRGLTQIYNLLWLYRRSRSSPFREWSAAFRSHLGRMFDTTRGQMNNWRGDNPCAFGDQVDGSNLQTTSSGQVKRAGERISWYCSDDLRAMIEPPSCRQYEPGDFLVVRPFHWDEIMDKDDGDENRADPGAPSGGRSRPGDGFDNEDSEGEEDTQGSEKGTGKGKGTMDGKGKGMATEDGNGKGKGTGKGNGKRKCIVKQIPGGDDISHAIALQLQKAMTESDLDMESESEFDSERDFDVDMRIEDDVDAADSIDLNGNVDMAMDGQDVEEKEEDDGQEEEEMDEDEEEDQDEDENNGKEP